MMCAAAVEGVYAVAVAAFLAGGAVSLVLRMIFSHRNASDGRQDSDS